MKSAAERHISEIRTQKFSIGKKNPNPLNLDLHHAVTGLSAELYTKDVHFIMELIQNAEDNEYPDGVEPTLEFLLTKTDITGRGAS
ncbi:DNA binding ATP binding [Euphorbia peplus]|nr:DNA binding ATP binding [Euphorbia peplus]